VCNVRALRSAVLKWSPSGFRSALGTNSLASIFVELVFKVNGRYYREILLPDIHQLSQFCVFRRARETIDLMTREGDSRLHSPRFGRQTVQT